MRGAFCVDNIVWPRTSSLELSALVCSTFIHSGTARNRYLQILSLSEGQVVTVGIFLLFKKINWDKLLEHCSAGVNFSGLSETWKLTDLASFY